MARGILGRRPPEGGDGPAPGRSDGPAHQHEAPLRRRPGNSRLNYPQSWHSEIR
jgi:hypothetical protein